MYDVSEKNRNNNRKNKLGRQHLLKAKHKKIQDKKLSYIEDVQLPKKAQRENICMYIKIIMYLIKCKN